MYLPSFTARVGGCPGGVFSKFCIYSYLQFPVLVRLVAIGALTLHAGVLSADDTAERLHLLPFIIDGEGIQSRLIVTNISDFSSHCSLDFSGPGLDTRRFEGHFLLTTDDARAMFELEEQGGNLIWTSQGELALTFGYARLDCAQMVVAQVLVTLSDTEELVSMTSVSGSRKADEFQYTVVPQVGSLKLIFANDVNPEASCNIELKTHDGSVLNESSFVVPEMTSVFQTVDELFQIPDDFTAGAVRIACDQEVAASGFILNGGVFTALAPAIFAPDSSTDPDTVE